MSFLSPNPWNNYVSLRIQDKPLKWPKVFRMWFCLLHPIINLTLCSKSLSCLPAPQPWFPDVLRKCQMHTIFNTALTIYTLWDSLFHIFTQLSSPSRWLNQRDQTWSYYCFSPLNPDLVTSSPLLFYSIFSFIHIGYHIIYNICSYIIYAYFYTYII